MSIIVSFSGSTDIPESRVSFVVEHDSGRSLLRVSCPNIADYIAGDTAQIGVEVIKQNAFAPNSMHTLGAISEFRTGLKRTIDLGGGSVDPKSLRLRLVASEPDTKKIIARTEQVQPMLRKQGQEGDLGPSQNTGYFAIRYNPDLPVAIRGSMAYEHPTIELNPDLIDKSHMHNDAFVGLHLPMVIEKMVLAMIINGGPRPGEGWLHFEKWMLEQAQFGSWEDVDEFVQQNDAVTVAEGIAKACLDCSGFRDAIKQAYGPQSLPAVAA